MACANRLHPRSGSERHEVASQKIANTRQATVPPLVDLHQCGQHIGLHRALVAVKRLKAVLTSSLDTRVDGCLQARLETNGPTSVEGAAPEYTSPTMTAAWPGLQA